MKKSIKIGAGIVVLAGVTAAIAVPATLASKKHKKVGYHFSKKDSFINKKDGKPGTIGDFMEDAQEVTQAQGGLLNRVEQQLSFKAYEAQQKGSIKYQEVFFNWEKYQIKKELINILTSTSDLNDTDKPYDADLINKPKTMNDMTYENIKKEVDAKLGALKDETKKNSIDTKIKAQVSKWNELKDKIDKLTKHADEIFDDNDWQTKYPKLLMPIEQIRDKQSKIFDEAKEAYIDAGTGNGDEAKGSWPEEMTKRYGGATNKEEALNYLVGQQVQNKAFAKFSYKINSDFTVEMVTSTIFNKMLGMTKNMDESDPQSIDGVIYVNDDTTNADIASRLAEKTYFVGTGSYVFDDKSSEVNPGKAKINVDNLGDYTKIRNQIIGIAPQFKDPNALWGFGSKLKLKESLTNILTAWTFDDGGTPKLVWGPSNGKDVYQDDEDLTKMIVANSSGSYDSSRYKSGDYGWKPALDNVKGMVSSFADGALIGMQDMKDDTTITAVSNPTDVIDGIHKAIKTAFDKYVYLIGHTALSGPTKPEDVDAYNKEVKTIIDNADESKLASEFGVSLKEELKKISLGTENLVSDDGKIKLVYDMGVPKGQTVAADGTSQTHNYLVTSEEFGMHYIQIENGTQFKDDMYDDLQKMATDQGESKISTNYSQLISSLNTQSQRMKDLLEYNKPAGGGDATIKGGLLDGILKDNKSDIFTDDSKMPSNDEAKEQIVKAIEISATVDAIDDVESKFPNSNITWLETQFDNGIYDYNKPYDSTATFNIDEIYNWALGIEMGGNN